MKHTKESWTYYVQNINLICCVVKLDIKMSIFFLTRLSAISKEERRVNTKNLETGRIILSAEQNQLTGRIRLACGELYYSSGLEETVSL
jgi:hypothetical protein